MNRDIKFRVWDKIVKPARMKTWGQLCAQYQLTQVFTAGNDFFELMQYTGLKDKNGKEIYEGDIYHMGDKNIRYVVVLNDTGLIGKQLGSKSYAGLSFWQDKIEVIGNIYTTPELLKEGE